MPGHRPWPACWAIGSSARGLRGGVASSSGRNSRSSARPSGPKWSTGKPSSGAARSTAIARTRVEHDPAPGPQLPAVRRRDRSDDGRGRAALPRSQSRGLHGKLGRQRGQRPDLPPDDRPRAHRHQAAADAERSVPVDLARYFAGSPDPTGVRMVRRDQAGGLPGSVAARPARPAVRRDRARRGPLAARGEDPAVGIQTLVGPVRRKYGLEGGPWLLTVARLDFHKGIDTVIRALPAIRAAFPSARYAVAGIGSRRSALEALVSELGLVDAVRLLGFVPDDDLPSLYRAADLFVLVSRRYDLLVEGFGIAIVEASASGLPVIASRSGGIPEAVREGETGFLVDPDDPAAVAAPAIRLLGDDGLRRRMGAAGRAAVETYYNWDRVAADLIRIDREFRSS